VPGSMRTCHFFADLRCVYSLLSSSPVLSFSCGKEQCRAVRVACGAVAVRKHAITCSG
jgi:hypothetical protein